MKVKIGKYPTHLSCNIHQNYMVKKYGYNYGDNQTKVEYYLEKVEDFIQYYICMPINKLYFFKKERKVCVRIDYPDTWSMDNTLSHIIVPMLEQVREQKQESPSVDNGDVPKELRCPEEKENNRMYLGETDENFHKRWDYVLNEMIFAFKFIRDENVLDYDKDKREDLGKRVQNGLRLFGKYYRSLWD